MLQEAVDDIARRGEPASGWPISATRCPVRPGVSAAATTRADRAARRRALPVFALAVALWFAAPWGCRGSEAPGSAPVLPTPAAPRVAALPGGSVGSLLPESFPDRFAAYLASAQPVGRVLRVEGVEFDDASIALRGDSARVVADLAAILAAFPSVQIRLDGYADDAGDETRDIALSQARADAVKERLVAAGVAGGRIATAGWGSGAGGGRRVELLVVAK